MAFRHLRLSPGCGWGEYVERKLAKAWFQGTISALAWFDRWKICQDSRSLGPVQGEVNGLPTELRLLGSRLL